MSGVKKLANFFGFLFIVASVALTAHLISKNNMPELGGRNGRKPPPRVRPRPISIAPGWVGLRGGDVVGQGVSVLFVYVGGPADRAGIAEGDVLASIDGRAPATCAELGRAVSTAAIGSAIAFDVVSSSGSRRSVKLVVDGEAGVDQLVIETIGKGAIALAGIQRSDGFWPDKRARPGELKPDVTATAMACAALAIAGPDAGGQARDALSLGLSHLRARRGKDGAIEDAARPSRRARATSFWLLALARDADHHRAELEAARAWLASAQLADGGWSDDGKPGNAELWTTSWALEALAAAKLPRESPTWEKAASFLARCQNLDGPSKDGGFAFAPEWSLAGGDIARSFGAATADGVRALASLPPSADRDRRLAAAAQWLGGRFVVDRCPGFGRDPAGWSTALELRWLASAARALSSLGIERLDARAWAPPLGRMVAAHEDAAGGWWIGSSQLDEDDPTVATSLALVALAGARDRPSGGRALAIAAPPAAVETPSGRAFQTAGCASCHLERGGPFAPSLAGVGERYISRSNGRDAAASYLRRLVRDDDESPPLDRGAWPTHMPPYPADVLSDADLGEVVSFLLSGGR